MLYLFDANTIIDANRDYYPIDRVPAYWQWLHGQAIAGTVKIPLEIFNEITTSHPLLKDFLKNNKTDFVLDEPVNIVNVNTALDQYGHSLSVEELAKIGQDPFLIAYCLTSATKNRVVVTKEVSARKKLRQNRRIPDVCGDLGVPCIDDFECLRNLGFKI